MPDISEYTMNKYWKLTGFVSTVIIVVLFPVYLLKYSNKDVAEHHLDQATYVGRESCIECHRQEYGLWLGSHHDLAMDTAIESTVLGNFNNYKFRHKGKTHRMFKKEGKFIVHTEGENGVFEDHQVAYTFGYTPLQQYLVPFGGGRLQCLPIAWDTDRQRWFHLGDTTYPYEVLDHENWLYWTNQGQNWNGMCADCHSTNLKKKYDPHTKTFHTSWSEIDVSCEACHGPASKHLEWANLPEGSRPENTHAGFLFKSKNLDKNELLGICARCHSRRSVLSDYNTNIEDMLNLFVPQKLIQPFFHADGQILEEDYVFASFTQSKMFKRGVKCSDCHDVHSGKLLIRGNNLCLQCHRPDLYDTPEHHFHKMPGDNLQRILNNTGKPSYVTGEGAQCINCHMVGQHYMGIDYRRDHSFRIPRPDLTIEIGTPNACNACHEDKSPQWAQIYIESWYGKKKRPHFGTTFALAQQGDETAVEKLRLYATNELFPVMVRATSLILLGNFNDSLSREAIIRNMDDPESLVRHSALMSFKPLNLRDQIGHVSRRLNDPVKAIRAEAAIRLTSIPRDSLSGTQRIALDQALKEYQEINEYMSDFPNGNFNLGIMYMNTGEFDKSESCYKEAIGLDSLFYQAKVNLAMLYNRQNKNAEAEMLFKEVLSEHPDLYDINYSLGLLLAEKQEFEESLAYLEKAFELMPENIRILYNLALLENRLQNYLSAENYLKEALTMEPANYDFLYAIATFYIEQKRFSDAEPYATKIKELYPQNPIGNQLINIILDSK